MLTKLQDNYVATWTMASCLGAVVLPDELPLGTDWIDQLTLTGDVAGTAVVNKHYAVENNERLKSLIVRNTISTMISAGQIEYLRASGLTGGGYKIVIEIHYYANRASDQIGFHKDTKGQTLFVNLNYLHSDPLLGPEYIVNPARSEQHEAEIKKTLPRKFRKDLKEVRRGLADPTEIGVSIIEPGGFVAFVDELIHHTTPLYGGRRIRADMVDAFLKKNYPDEYAMSTKSRGFFGSKETDEEKRIRKILSKLNGKQPLDRTQLAQIGLTLKEINALIELYNDVNGNLPGRYPFEFASIPTTDPSGKAITNPVRKLDTPPLTRQVSSLALQDRLPKQIQGNRQFFRTWIRAVPRTYD